MTEIAIEKEPRLCQHPGCSSPGIQYYLPTGEPDKEPESEYYCAEHAHAHGYCYKCGCFWGGVEAFEFNAAGLCPNCRDDISGEEPEDDIPYETDSY